MEKLLKKEYTLAEICFFPRKKSNVTQQQEPILLSWYVHSYQQSPVRGFWTYFSELKHFRISNSFLLKAFLVNSGKIIAVSFVFQKR